MKSFQYLFLLFIFCGGLAYSQNYSTEWVDVTKGNRMTYLNSIYEDGEGNIYSTGNIRDTLIKVINGKVEVVAIEKGDVQFIQKMDKNGNVTYIKHLKGSFPNPAILAVTKKNGTIVPTVKHPSKAETGQYGSAIFLTHFNWKGDEIWHKQIIQWRSRFSPQLQLNSIHVLADESLLITGTVGDSIGFNGGEMMRSEKSGSVLFVVKLTSKGDFIWQKQINTTRGNRLVKTCIKEDGHILLIGNLPGSINVGNDTIKNPNWRDKNCFILELDAQGDLVAMNRFSDLSHTSIDDVFLDQENNLYLSGSFFDSTNFSLEGKNQNLIYDATANTDAFLMKLNANLETEWVKTAGIEGSILGRQVKQVENTIFWEIEYTGKIDSDPSTGLKILHTDKSYNSQNAGRVLFTYSTSGLVLETYILPEKTNFNPDDLFFSSLKTFYHLGQREVKNKDDSWASICELSKHQLIPTTKKDTLTIEACDSFTWKTNGITYNTAGTHTNETKNDLGETVIQQLNLTIYSIDKSILINGTSLTANENEATYQWLDCTNGCVPIENAKHQTFYVNKTGIYAVIIGSKLCPIKDTSDRVSVFIKEIDPNLKGFYQAGTDFYYFDFEKEHIQLDPTTVSMIPYRVGKLFGFVENGNTEKWLIQPQFEQVFSVNYDCAIVKDTALEYGVVNTQGDFIVPPIYPNLFFENGVYHGVHIFQSDTALHLPSGFQGFNTHSFFDLNGNLLFKEYAHEHTDFTTENLAWFRFGTHYTVRNKKGAIVKEFEFDELKDFIGVANNLLLFHEIRNNKSHCVGYQTDGKEVFAVASNSGRKTFQLTPDFYGELSGYDNYGDYYFIDGDGEKFNFGINSWDVDHNKTDSKHFTQNEFVVQDFDSNLFGLINRSGDTLLDFKYRTMGNLNDGLRFVQEEGEMMGQFLDKNGEVVIEAFDWTKLNEYRIGKFRDILAQELKFSDSLIIGLVPQTKKDTLATGEIIKRSNYDSLHFCYFNMKGDTILELPSNIEIAGHFSDGLAPAINSDKGLGFINKKGEWIIEPIYELTVAGSYPIPYFVIPYFENGFAYIKSFKGYVDKNGKPYFEGEQLKDHYNFSH